MNRPHIHAFGTRTLFLLIRRPLSSIDSYSPTLSKGIKMNSWFKALPILGLITLSGCSSGFHSSELEMNDRSLAEKAIVVARIHAPHTNMVLGETDSVVCSVWQNTDNSELKYNFYVPGALSYFQPADLQEHMIVPGTYALKSMRYKIYGTEYDLSFSKNTKITFTAKPGEVVYLGDIEIVNPKGGEYSLKVADNFEAAEKQLKRDLPGLNKPMETRLVKGIY